MSERKREKIFFARTGDKNWQLLAEHLANVSRMAEDFADEFFEGVWGIWLGLLHDIGKYGEKFQQRLLDPKLRVDHSTAGAKEIIAQIAARAGQSASGKRSRLRRRNPVFSA